MLQTRQRDNFTIDMIDFIFLQSVPSFERTWLEENDLGIDMS